MDEYLFWFLIIYGAAIIIAVDFLIAFQFQRIAELKGHHEKIYFWWCFICGVCALGFVGYLMVIALPDRGKQIVAEAKTKEPAPEELPEI